MRNIFLAIALLIAYPCFAQTTAVTATITDSDSTVWANGTYSISFIPPPGNNSPPIYNGSPMTPAQKGPYTGALNGSGTISVSLPDNTFITPAGSVWKFTICPNASASCSQINQGVSGSSQNFTSQFSALVSAPRFSATVGAYGYNTTEIVVIPPPGGNFYNVTLGCTYVWSGSAWACSGGGNAIAPNQSTVYVSPNCGTQPNCYPVLANGKTTQDAHTTSGQNTVSSATATFTAADVGKKIFISQSCVSGLALPILVELAETTIATFVDAHDITTTINASNTSTTGCMFYGSPDDTNLSAIDTALSTQPNCPVVVFPVGYMLVESPHFNTQPTICSTQLATRAWTYGGGVRFTGQGPYSTVLVMSPNFATASCPTGTGRGCWNGIVASQWDNLMIWGVNFSEVGSTANTVLFGLNNYDVVTNVQLAQWGEHNTNNQYGVAANGAAPAGAHLYHTQIDGFGYTCLQAANGDVIVLNNETTVEDCAGTAGTVASDVVIISGGEVVALGSSAFGSYVGSGATMFLIDNSGQMLFEGNTNCFANGATTAQNCVKNEATGTLYAYQSQPSGFNGGAGIYNHGGTVYLQGNGFNGQPAVGQDNNGVTYDFCGNRFNGGLGGLTPGTWYGSCSFNTTPLTIAKLVLSANWGTGAAVSVPLGANSPITFTITNGSASTGASPTITYTFPTPYGIAPLWCTATQSGGTNPTGTFTAGTPTATSVVFTYSLTPTASDTELMQVQCFSQ